MAALQPSPQAAGNLPLPGRNCGVLGGFSSAQEFRTLSNFSHNFFTLCIPPHTHRRRNWRKVREGEGTVSWKPLHLIPEQTLPPHNSPSPLSGHFEATLRERAPPVLFIRWVTQWLTPQLLNTQPLKPRWGPIHSDRGKGRGEVLGVPLRPLLCCCCESLQPGPRSS